MAFSSDGTASEQRRDDPLNDQWIWRVTWKKDAAYGLAYRITDFNNFQKPWVLSLFKTNNGLDFEKIVTFDIKKFPSEGTIRFDSDGKAVALLRRATDGLICRCKSSL